MSIFAELADYIDDLYINPYHQPHDENRAFVKIFKHLLREEDAGFAMLLSSSPERAEQIAERAAIPVDECIRILHNLSGKGIVFSRIIGGREHFNLSPFCPGILEFLQSEYLDAGISGFLQEYVEEINRFLGGEEIPLNINIDINLRSLSLEEAVHYIDQSGSYSLSDCMCRSAKHMIGEGCGHTIKDMCIQTGEYADFYIRTGRARKASRDEVIAVLKQAEEENLFHEASVSDTLDNSCFICNCCPCCCLSLRTVLAGRMQPAPSAEGRNTAEIQKLKCSGCGACVDVCPQGAIYEKDNTAAKEIQLEIDRRYCIGCGLCMMFCEENAIFINTKK